MKNKRILLLLVLYAFASCAMATRNRENECIKPRFSKFVPEQYSVVPPGSEFSFVASGNTMADTIKVAVKKIETEITIEDKDIFYKVRGRLPESLVGTFARITISAKGDSGKSETACRLAKGGWLIKISEEAEVEEENVGDERQDGEEEGIGVTEMP
ncbi:MAG: hypothetical protein V3V31_03410 [Methylococcales bacterium]